MRQKINFGAISIIISALVICFTVSSYIFAWTEPTVAPPGGNVFPPINVSVTGQSKLGDLGIGGGSGQPTYWLSNVGGALRFNSTSPVATRLVIGQDGNVGIGATSPGYKLDVAGSFNATGIYISGTQKNIVWDAKEPAIIAGTTAQYWRGDKTWQTLPSSAISSVFGRTGAVVATSGDYSVAQVTGAAPIASPTFTGVVNVGAGYGFHSTTNDSWLPYTNGYNYLRGTTYAFNGVWYDENNTGYYVDPASTSIFNDLRANALTVNGQNVCQANGTNCPTQSTNADTVDSLHAASFLRKDVSDTIAGGVAVYFNTGNWSGDAGGSQGKIQYHANRFYIDAEPSPAMILQFRKGGTDLSYIDANGVFQGTANYATSAGNADTTDGYHLNQDVRTTAAPTFAEGPYTNSWFRVNGGGGIYWQAYGGGWYMQDGSWLRAYNNVGVYTAGEMQAGTIRGNTQLCIGSSCRTSWPTTDTSAFATHRGEGTNFIDYSRYVYNNGAYSGSGWIEPSDLGVRYANSAGNADTVDGLHASSFLTSETDPQVGTLTNGKWCTSNGSAVNCASDLPIGIAGSGTANYLSKWTTGATLGNSLIYDNGTNIGIGTTSPTKKLDVDGDIKASGKIYAPGAWTYVASVELGADATNISISNIPSGFKMLKIIFKLAGSSTSAKESHIQFNGDVGASSYDWAYFATSGGTVTAPTANRYYGRLGYVGALKSPILWEVGELTITNIASEKKSGTLFYSMYEPGVYSEIGTSQMYWNNSTNEINSFIISLSSGNIKVGSSVIVQGMTY